MLLLQCIISQQLTNTAYSLCHCSCNGTPVTMNASLPEHLDDPIHATRAVLRRSMAGVGTTTAVLNVLLIAGSLYMMLVYDLVIPSRRLMPFRGCWR
jgi:hypothetical protein